ncbi:MAG TPA: hypothetical protein VGM98_14295, partial [Schlesneria sp.]
MGGQEGNRGYLVQSVVALLHSLDDPTWSSVTIEPSSLTQKVDILWVGQAGCRAVQVKSSINQMTVTQAKAWATELRAEVIADSYSLILVGPASQDLARLNGHSEVSIPCPKNLDWQGFLNEGAHQLDKFLHAEGLGQTVPKLRELMVLALVTQLSLHAAEGQMLSREDLVSLVKRWIGTIENVPQFNSSWETVSFENQRGIESAVAGQRLGPADVDACPTFPICREIIDELNRSHIHELVGIPGSGKSVTAWQVAKHHRQEGFLIWRPQPFSTPNDLLRHLPTELPSLLVVDDAQRCGKPFATRLAELANSKIKVLLVSTIKEPQLTNPLCINPGQAIDELSRVLAERRSEILPILKQFDDRIGDRQFETSIENRLYHARRQTTPWEFFWVLRGGWNTAKRELECLEQFTHDRNLLLVIAAGQIVTCDAGVSKTWLVQQISDWSVAERELRLALDRLASLGLITPKDELRTKHIQFAYAAVELAFDESQMERWLPSLTVYAGILRDGSHSLKGLSWLLGAIRNTDAFRKQSSDHFSGVASQLIQRCTTEGKDLESAAGCLNRVFG